MSSGVLLGGICTRAKLELGYAAGKFGVITTVDISAFDIRYSDDHSILHPRISFFPEALVVHPDLDHHRGLDLVVLVHPHPLLLLRTRAVGQVPLRQARWGLVLPRRVVEVYVPCIQVLPSGSDAFRIGRKSGILCSIKLKKK